MSTLLKDRYNNKFFSDLGEGMNKVLKNYDHNAFVKTIHKSPWKKMELKDRMKRIAESLAQILPSDYKKAIIVFKNICDKLRVHKDYGLEFMFLPEYIEAHGLEYFEESMKAMEKITSLTSCEFAIRPFIIKYPKKSIKRLIKWSKHKDLHVRRLASEGCRPRLPWAIALPDFKKDPKAILPILENLKNDPSEYVRRSVANNLNDISKDNPDTFIKTVKPWLGKNQELDAIVKHGSRTLLKAGDNRVYAMYGITTKGIEISNLEIPSAVKIGNKLNFNFEVTNSNKSEKYIRLEYAIYFLLKNGKLSKKVYKISEGSFTKNEHKTIQRFHNFKIITTKKYYPGGHELAIIANGKEIVKKVFKLNQ